MGDLRRAIVAWRVWRTPATILRELRDGGSDRLDDAWTELSPTSQDEVRAITEQLEGTGVQAMLFGDPDYPAALAGMKSPPPVAFLLGNTELLERRAIGVCGSRAVSADGLDAARSLARTVATNGDVLVAGNAQGVDAEAQGTALAADGAVITVLPEGITHLRLRTGTVEVEPASDQLLAISQFPPWQPWSVGGAMTRNDVIIGLSAAIVVIEAGERGGTLAAGEAALRAGRPVIALEYGNGTPPGNTLLLRRGARGASSTREVYAHIVAATAQPAHTNDLAAQLPLAF